MKKELRDDNQNMKQYAKDAKKRMSVGFWEEYREYRDHIKKSAASDGRNAETALAHHKKLVTQKIYDYENYILDEEFYKKVCEIIESDEVITNPIILLADKLRMEELGESQMQAYLLSIANRYEKMRVRYYKEHS